jgi:hypothetical protein
VVAARIRLGIVDGHHVAIAITDFVGNRSRRGGHDGEPVVRPLSRLAARCRRAPGRSGLQGRGRRSPQHVPALGVPGCGHPDPDHSWTGGRTEYNSGACDGWLRAGTNDEFAIGYYEAADLAFYGHAAPYWTVCDRYFAAIMAETYPNRFYLHAGQTDRLTNDGGPTISTLPTIWDRLSHGGHTGCYYFSDAPFTALWGEKYPPISW